MACVCALVMCAQHGSAQLITTPESLKDVGIVDRIGEQVPLDAVFTDASGRRVELGSFFDGERPVLLIPVYFDCPILCPQTLQRVLFALNDMDWMAGKQFRVVCYSFDHTENYRTARAKQEATLAGYTKEWAPAGASKTWAFLTADDPKVSKRVSKAIGFHYKYAPASGQYAHGAAIFFMTPKGEVHNYIEGLDLLGEDLQKGLKEARDGEERSIFASAFLWCYPYNDETGSRTPAMWRIMTVGASGAALLLFAVIGYLIFKTGRRLERERSQRDATADEIRAGGVR